MTLKSLLKIVIGVYLLGAVATQSAAQSVVSVTQIKYDEYNRPICSTVRMNPAVYSALPADACILGTAGSDGPDRIMKNTYDAAGQLLRVDQAYGTSVQRAYVRYTYTLNGLKQSETDANGNRTTLEYDVFDRLVKVRYPSTAVGSGVSSTKDYEQYNYDANGNRTYTRRRDGQVMNDCFDSLNRIIIHYVHAQSGCTTTGGAKDVYFTYDGLGHILSKRFASTSGSGVTYAYDSLGRVRSTTDMNNRTVSYQYNTASARTRLTLPDASYFGYTLDNTNRVTAEGPNATTGLYTLIYDSLGNRTQLNRGAGAAVTTYAYDNLGRLTSQTVNPAGTSNDITWTFARNPASQIRNWSASSAVYDYIETVNSTTSQTYDGLNRDAAIAALTGGYDARGNLTKDGVRTFTYDIENRLLTKTSTTDGQPNITLTYDPEGRLSGYTSGSTTITLLYDGVNLIREYSGTTSTVLRTYVHGPGTDEPVVWFEGAGTATKRFLIANYQGSIIGYTDSAGNLAQLYKYGSYGEPKGANNSDLWSGSRFRYTGQTMLPEARLYYYKARVYDPNYGRFLQTDPVGSKADLDLYAYVGGDPVNRADPTGLDPDRFGPPGLSSDYRSNEYQAGVWAANHPLKALGNVIMAAAVVIDLLDTPVSPGPDASLVGVAAKTGLSRAEQMTVNASQGARGEAMTSAKLGDNVAGKQITFKTSDGTRTRADFVTKDGSVVETKTGNAQLTKGQAKLHDDIQAGREVTPVGKNAQDMGLRSGQPTKMTSCQVDRPC